MNRPSDTCSGLCYAYNELSVKAKLLMNSLGVNNTNNVSLWIFGYSKAISESDELGSVLPMTCLELFLTSFLTWTCYRLKNITAVTQSNMNSTEIHPSSLKLPAAFLLHTSSHWWSCVWFGASAACPKQISGSKFWSLQDSTQLQFKIACLEY